VDDATFAVAIEVEVVVGYGMYGMGCMGLRRVGDGDQDPWD
jgi:hypothetical protein